MADHITQPAQTQLYHAQATPSAALQVATPAALENPHSQQDRQQHCQRQQQQQTLRMTRLVDSALLPVQTLTLFVPKQLLRPRPLAVSLKTPGAGARVADQQPGLLPTPRPVSRHRCQTPARFLEQPGLPRPTPADALYQLRRRHFATVGQGDLGAALQAQKVMPTQGYAGVQDDRPGQTAIGQQGDDRPGGQAGLHAPQQPGNQQRQWQRRLVGAVADGHQRHGPFAIGDADLEHAQGVGFGRFVQQQVEASSRPRRQQIFGQVPQGQPGLQAVVGQQAFLAALRAGGLGGPGDGGGDVAGLALPTEGDAQGEIGQRFELMSMQLRQELATQTLSPVLYNSGST